MTTLPQQIDMARAALGPEPVYRRRGVAAVSVPRADVEVDIDMESTEEGVYLWGCLFGHPDEASNEYISFATWVPFTSEAEADNSHAFWQWLTDMRADAHRCGATFRAYCWNSTFGISRGGES